MTTPADLPELPPLPNLQQQWQRQQITLQNQLGVQWTELRNFTSDEMRSYARAYGQACYAAGVRAGMERAAVIAEAADAKYERYTVHDEWPDPTDVICDIADAIRAAKHEKQATE